MYTVYTYTLPYIEIQRALCVPGPDLVVCDEGHRIKNDYTNISQALKKIITRSQTVHLYNRLPELFYVVGSPR